MNKVCSLAERLDHILVISDHGLFSEHQLNIRLIREISLKFKIVDLVLKKTYMNPITAYACSEIVWTFTSNKSPVIPSVLRIPKDAWNVTFVISLPTATLNTANI
ncbi:hypothetical protein CEXT_473011 [Caerostris extrusa]|uniref:Uncharacterized protein n=1 Tax=Caerostris extrusa TaxID=172846 RepID=A0AAV4UC02_CAEEX|nr:hypothetical protein CEXT_473011 [Caerostris extrusa]